jgi:predicted RND superfamily exporter protein
VSHPLGVVVAFASVLGMTVFGFRSLLLGLLSLVPVVLAVLMVYALMGGLDIWLGSGTGMTTSIAVGLAVDFAIHMIDRIRTLMREEGLDAREALRVLYPSTGRALFFNLAALLLGFGVLVFSAVPSLMQFGLLVVVCVVAAFIGSLTIIPAMLLLWPRLLARVVAQNPLQSPQGGRPWNEA